MAGTSPAMTPMDDERVPRGRRGSVDVEALDRPAGRWASNPGRRDLRAVHEPDPHIAAGVLQENVALAVAVEVAGLGDRPAGGHSSHPGRRRLGAIHEPDPHVAAGVLPENVALAVAVEVPGSGDRPTGDYSSDA